MICRVSGNLGKYKRDDDDSLLLAVDQSYRILQVFGVGVKNIGSAVCIIPGFDGFLSNYAINYFYWRFRKFFYS